MEQIFEQRLSSNSPAKENLFSTLLFARFPQTSILLFKVGVTKIDSPLKKGASHYVATNIINVYPQTYSKLNFYVDDRTYWTPGTTALEIYDQLASKNYREIPKRQLKYVN